MRMESEKKAFLIGIIAIAVFILGNIVMAIINNNRLGAVENAIERTVTEIKKEDFAFETRMVSDDTVDQGKTVVKSEGAKGEKTYTYSVTYKGKTEISRELVKEEITRQPVTRIVANGAKVAKVVWTCEDTTSFDRNPNNDNLCISSNGEKRYVDDCIAVSLAPDFHPSQSGASRYNGCPNY